MMAELTDPQRRALAVLAAAENLDSTHRDKRPCRTSNKTSGTDVDTTEMLTVHHAVADDLADAGLVRIEVFIGLLELTAAGRELARESGLA